MRARGVLCKPFVSAFVTRKVRLVVAAHVHDSTVNFSDTHRTLDCVGILLNSSIAVVVFQFDGTAAAAMQV